MEDNRTPILKRLFNDIAAVFNFYVEHEQLEPNEAIMLFVSFLAETFDRVIDEKEQVVSIIDEISQKIKDNWRKEYE